MEQLADRLAERIHTLNKDQLAEVEQFVASLENCESDRTLTKLAMQMSAPSFKAIWDNPEDEVYDAL